MRHRIAGRKLQRSKSHRQSLLRNQAVSLILYEKIQTTLPKAKETQTLVEKIITAAKSKDIAAKRTVNQMLDNKNAAKKVREVLEAKYQTRPGGYTRLIKIGARSGDNSQLVQLELV